MPQEPTTVASSDVRKVLDGVIVPQEPTVVASGNITEVFDGYLVMFVMLLGHVT